MSRLTSYSLTSTSPSSLMPNPSLFEPQNSQQLRCNLIKQEQYIQQRPQQKLLPNGSPFGFAQNNHSPLVTSHSLPLVGMNALPGLNVSTLPQPENPQPQQKNRYSMYQSVHESTMTEESTNRMVGMQISFFQENATTVDGKRIRHRRTFKELSREVSCPYPGCKRSYATKSSLATHVRLKHGDEPVPPSNTKQMPNNRNLIVKKPNRARSCSSGAQLESSIKGMNLNFSLEMNNFNEAGTPSNNEIDDAQHVTDILGGLQLDRNDSNTSNTNTNNNNNNSSNNNNGNNVNNVMNNDVNNNMNSIHSNHNGSLSNGNNFNHPMYIKREPSSFKSMSSPPSTANLQPVHSEGNNTPTMMRHQPFANSPLASMSTPLTQLSDLNSYSNIMDSPLEWDLTSATPSPTLGISGFAGDICYSPINPSQRLLTSQSQPFEIDILQQLLNTQ
eukprot:Awhi_evm1s12616